MSTDALIEDWLDGTLDDVNQRELEHRLEDPSVAKRLVQSAHFQHSLRRLAAKPRPMTRRAAGRRQFHPATRQRPFWWWGLAACLCLASGIWLYAARRSTAADLPLVAGMPLVVGQVLETNDAPILLQWKDGTDIELAAKSALRVAPLPGKHLELLRGSVQAKVSRQPSDSPLVISGTDCTAIVQGTSFRFTQAPASTQLQVTQGSVQLARSRDGFITTVNANEGCILPMHGQPHIERSMVTTMALADDGLQFLQGIQQGPKDSGQLITEPGVSGATAVHVTGTFDHVPTKVGPIANWILLHTSPSAGAWNLESSEGIEFWYRGTGSGQEVWVEILCQNHLNPVTNETKAHFIHITPDTIAGWRLIRLPWSVFTLRPDWAGQTPGTSLRAAHILAINIMKFGDQHTDFAVDRIAAWASPRPPIMPGR